MSLRDAVVILLDQIDPRLAGVLDAFVKKEHIKGWTRYHDELDKYPIGEYNSHLRQIVVEVPSFQRGRYCQSGRRGRVGICGW